MTRVMGSITPGGATYIGYETGCMHICVVLERGRGQQEATGSFDRGNRKCERSGLKRNDNVCNGRAWVRSQHML